MTLILFLHSDAVRAAVLKMRLCISHIFKNEVNFIRKARIALAKPKGCEQNKSVRTHDVECGYSEELLNETYTHCTGCSFSKESTSKSAHGYG